MKELHNTYTSLVKDIIIGKPDGLIVPFALTQGLSGVLNTNHHLRWLENHNGLIK